MIYPVIGLQSESSGELMVAEVVEGEHMCRDTGTYGDEHGDWQRVAHHVEAEDADEAANLAAQQAEQGDAEFLPATEL